MNEAGGIIVRGAGDKPNVPVPYDYNSHGPVPLRSMSDITAFDEAFRSITADLPKPILLGSIARLSELALPNWGIEVNGGNRRELREYADRFYRMDDTDYTPERTARDQLHAYKRSLQADCLRGMETNSSNIITNLLESGAYARKKEISVCHLAAGAANVVRSVITRLGCSDAGKAILEKTVFHLVDSPEKLALIERNLGGNPRVVLHAKSCCDFLAEMKGGGKKFDFVISVSQFHRKPFLSDFLSSIHAIMKDKALLVAADWHSPLTLCPFGVYGLLSTLNVPNSRLRDFEALFGPFMHKDCREDNRSNEDRALTDHLDYWKNLSGNMEVNQHCLKVRIMSAFLTQRQLAMQLEKSGFNTDIARIRAAFPQDSVCAFPSKLPVRIRDRSDTAAVTLAMRR